MIITGAFGEIDFNLKFNPKDINEKRTWRLIKQALLNGYPAYQFLGEDERTINLSLTLHRVFSDIKKSEKKIIDYANENEIKTLVIGEQIMGRFAIRSYSRGAIILNQQNVILKADYAIDLVEIRS